VDDEQALRRGIFLAPEDDLPRLVYADWLEEHGEEERARFIRLQCDLAEAKAGPDRTCRGYAVNMRAGARCGRCLACRATVLLVANREAWLPAGWTIHNGLEGSPTGTNSRAMLFRRGLGAELICTVEVFRQHQEELLWPTPACRLCFGNGERTWHQAGCLCREPCSNCSGTGWVLPTDTCPKCHQNLVMGHGYPDYLCGKCDQGRVPLPLPPTAHPIEVVRFVDWPFATRPRQGFRVEGLGTVTTCRLDRLAFTADWFGSVLFRVPGGAP
jgi:uncharacterized protein (TIGR02996 family)